MKWSEQPGLAPPGRANKKTGKKLVCQCAEKGTVQPEPGRENNALYCWPPHKQNLNREGRGGMRVL